MTSRTEIAQDEGSRRCPRCAQQLTAAGSFWICPTHGQIPYTEPSTSLCIFLSYGRAANEELVRRIKTDLEKRGDDVWFDKAEIKSGDDWRRAITDEILHSQRVVSFLSKHSTRDLGVCRDKIAIAIGDVEGTLGDLRGRYHLSQGNARTTQEPHGNQ